MNAPTLPVGWTRTILGELGTWMSGGTPSRAQPEYYGGNIPWVKTGDLADSPIRDVPEYITEEGLQNSAAKLLPHGTLLVAMYGATIGRLGLLELEAATNQACAALLPHNGTGELIPYIFQYLLSQRDELRRIGQGGAQPNISQGILKNYGIPVPPLNEQRRIVAKLEALQARSRKAREALDEVPALLEKLRQSILAAAFRGDLTKDWRAKNPDVEPAEKLLQRIRIERRKKWEETELARMKAKGKPPGDDRWKAKYEEPAPVDTTGLPKLPAGWCWVAWREIGFCQNGRAFPSSDYASEGVKLLRPGNLSPTGSVEWTPSNTRFMPQKWAEAHRDFIVRGNELVVNLTAQSLRDEFLGRVCLTDNNEECLLNQRIARLTPVAFSHKYWLWFFKAPLFRRYVDTLNTGSLIEHMFTSQIDACVAPIMPDDEALTLVEIIDKKLGAIYKTLFLVDEQVKDIQSLEQALLSKAFRGELVPQDPNDEPASAMLARLKATASAAESAPTSARRGAKRPHKDRLPTDR